MEKYKKNEVQVRIHVPMDMHMSMMKTKIDRREDTLQEYSLKCMRRGHELYLAELNNKQDTAEVKDVAA